MTKLIVSLLCCILAVSAASAQTYYAKEIEAFRQLDAQDPPSGGGILFVGSSTFTMWKDIKACFPGYRITNRGFGGSSMRDVLYYFEDVVTPHNPAQVILYEGDNDLSNRYTSVDDFIANVKCFVRLVQIRFPEADICIISIKPSPARRGYYGKYTEANKRLRALCNHTRGVRFIDLWDRMTDRNQQVRDKDHFRSDSLHMTASGYALWTATIQPYLKTK